MVKRFHLIFSYFKSVFQELQNHGMDKKINLAELYIPTPEVFAIDDLVHYTKLYKGEYKVPRQYIHVQVKLPLGILDAWCPYI